MTRHGKNATNAAVYTYHERRKDASASGYGTEHRRLTKDAVKAFDCCSLTLRPCRDPVVTPQGWLFDKEAVLKYVLEKKAEYHKKLAAWEKQRDRDFQELHTKAKKDEEAQRKEFEKKEKSISSTKDPVAGPSSSSKAPLPSYWVPSLTPDAKEAKLDRPSKTVLCPMSGKPLKIKDLITVKFTEIDDKSDKRSLIAKEERYRCPVTGDVLRNSGEVAVLKPTGDVVTADCVEKIIKKDMVHPLTGRKLEDSDIVYLQRGGTGYSAANEQLKAKHYRPSLAIN